MKLWGKPALLLAVTMIVAGCSSPPAVDPNIQAKADAFSSKVAADMKAETDAAAEARIIKLSFPKDRPLSVFYAGDSLSYSLYSSVEANGYRPLVNAELSKSGPISEARATKADPKALFQVGNVENIPSSGVDLAIIELGTNDVQKTEIGLFRTQYEALIAKVERSTTVQIICLGAWGTGGSLVTDPYDKVIQEVCEGHHRQYVDLTATYDQKDTYDPKGTQTWLGPSDGFHPNDKGHRAIADLILQRLKVN
jgi:acyl-CoA thioesterase-1